MQIWKAAGAALILAIPVIAGAALAPPAGAVPTADIGASPTIHTSVVVDNETVRLGDLFQNAGTHEEAEISRAPKPGSRISFDAARLYALARIYKIAWRPMSRFDRVVVRRASQEIGKAEIEAELRAELANRGVGGKMRIELHNRNPILHIATDTPATLAVETLRYDESTKRFTAALVAPAGQAGAARLQVSGRVYAVSEIPVLARRLNAGEIIRKGDIEWIELRTDRIARDTIVDAKRLIGFTPRRYIRPGKPIRASALRPPLLVAKKSVVTVILRTEQMLLTLQGRALEDGGRGDTIRILNPQSKQVIEAVVDGPGRATVMASRRTALN
jgi:flagella basal body P-ring formation protein FlgA